MNIASQTGLWQLLFYTHLPFLHGLLSRGLAPLRPLCSCALKGDSTFPVVKSQLLYLLVAMLTNLLRDTLLPCLLGSAPTVLFASACWVPPVPITRDPLAFSPFRPLVTPSLCRRTAEWYLRTSGLCFPPRRRVRRFWHL